MPKPAAPTTVWDFVIIACVAIAAAFSKPWPHLAALIGVATCLAMLLRIALREPYPEEGEETALGCVIVDPWEYQRQLMNMSDQRIPCAPSINNTSLLYGALIMEEAGETFEAIAEAMSELCPIDSKTDQRLSDIRQLFFEVGSQLFVDSTTIRTTLEKTTPFTHAPTEPHVKAMLDGTTDIAVVNCGFALASGLPGAAAYDEVASSNMSKADPATGRIHKDASGKWIKGPHYFKPDLARVLAEHARP